MRSLVPLISLSLADSQDSGKGGRSWKVAAQVPVRNCARGARRPAEKEGASGDAAAHTGLSWKVELETE